MMSIEEEARRHTEQWLNRVVIGLNLCPFAATEVDAGRLRYRVTPCNSEAALLQALEEEIQHLRLHPEVATSLLIHPQVLQDFADYNQFLDRAEHLLERCDAIGELQIASFHPGYRFAGTGEDDPANYSNRSPYPMLHLLREEDVERAVDSHPDIDAIPGRNIARLTRLGRARLIRLLASCREERA